MNTFQFGLILAIVASAIAITFLDSEPEYRVIRVCCFVYTIIAIAYLCQ